MIVKTAHLTHGFAPELERSKLLRSRPGMAHFAATGPFGATCGDCRFLGYWKQHRNGSDEIIRTSRAKGCGEFHRLTGRHGAALPEHTEACKYFQRKEEAR